MCKLDGTKCDNCLEYRIETDSGMSFEFTLDPSDLDNDVMKSWLLSTENVDAVLVRNVGNVVWTVYTYEEYAEEVGLNL